MINLKNCTNSNVVLPHLNFFPKFGESVIFTLNFSISAESFNHALVKSIRGGSGGGKGGDVPPLAFKEGEGGGRGEGRFWARRAKKYEK